MFKKQAFDFNVGKPVLPHGVNYFGDFATEIMLALMINDPVNRMSFNSCRDAMSDEKMPDITRGFLEEEFKTEFRIERGDFAKKDNKKEVCQLF
jgi:hypothetical protein